jgi:hypothetical protein
MFCPKCKAEFKPGISHCPECDVDLVETLPPEERVDFVKVFESSDPGLTAIIKSILDGAGIKYFVTGENIQSILGAKFEFAFGSDIGNAIFLVSKEDETTAMELLKELPESYEVAEPETE